MSVLPNTGLYPKKPLIILCYRNPIAILQHQLAYWFSKYSNGFYKFIEPCKHPLYKAGDSWTEEIGYSRPVFNKAFDTIGIRYKSKSEFLKSENKFQGKLYASYHDRKTNKTFFVRNADFTEVRKAAQTSSIVPSKPQANNNSSKKITTAHNHKILDQEKRGEASLNHRSRNETNNHSYGGTIGGKNKNSFTKITSSSSQATVETKTSGIQTESKKIAEELKNIWIEEIGSLDVSFLSKSLITNLNEAFKVTFETSLERWRTYCRQIASSMFLMGEKRGTNFKAKLSWAIQHDTFERIQAGEFTLGDRKVQEKPKNMTQEEENKACEELKQDLLNYFKDQTWIEACIKLSEKLGHKMVKKWLYPLDIITINATEVELQAPNLFMRDWIQKNLEKELKRTFQEILGSSLKYCRITSIASGI